MKQLHLLTATLFSLVLTASAATTYQWTNIVSGNASGSWNTAAAWNPAGPAGGSDNTAQFTLPLTNNVTGTTITLDGSRTIGNLIFGNTAASNIAWTVNAGTPATSTLTLGVSSGTPLISVTNRSVNFGAPLFASQGFNQTNSGTVQLSASNFFAGSSVVVQSANAFLNLNNLNALSGLGSLTISNGASAQAQLSGTYAYVTNTYLVGGGASGSYGALYCRKDGSSGTWPGPIVVNGATIGNYGASGGWNLSGVISGSNGLALRAGGSTTAHTGTYNLNTNETYTGSTTLNQTASHLRLNLNVTNTLPTTTSLVVNDNYTTSGYNITVDATGKNQTWNSLTVNGAAGGTANFITASGQPTLTLGSSSAGALAVNGGAINFNGVNVVATAAGGTPTGVQLGTTGTTTNNFTNSTFTGGYVNIGGTSSGAVNLNSGTVFTGTLEIMPGFNTSQAGVLNINTGAVVNAYMLRVGNAAAGAVNLNAGGALYVDRVYSAGSSNYFGFNGGLLTPSPLSAIASPWFESNLTNVQVQAGGAIITNAASQNVTIAASLLAGNPSGGLTKLGAGTLTLSGANNTYTNTTVVSNGTLVVDGKLLVSPATVQSALAGTGYVASATLNAGALLYPGRSNVVGTLSISNLTTVGGSELFFDLTNSGVAIGGQTNDLLVLTNASFGSQTLIGLNFFAGYPGTSNRYVIATYSGSAAGLANLSLDPRLVGTRPAIGLDFGTPGQIAVILTNGTASSAVTWYGNNPNNNWDLATTTNWNGGTDYFYTSDSVVFNDTAQTSVVNLMGSLIPAAVTFSNNSLAYTLTGSGNITGSAAVTLKGSGRVIVDVNNDNSGGTTLNGSGATLQIGSADTAGAIGGGDVQFVGSGSTLAYNRTDSVTLNNRLYSSGSVNANIQVNSGTLTLAGAADNSYATATVQGGGALVLGKSSTATIHALGGSSSTALTINASGAARLGGTGGDQISDSKDVQADGTFDLAGSNETINNLVGVGTVASSVAGSSVLSVGSANASVVFAGVLDNGSGTVGLTKLGTGSLTLTGTNTATGPLTVIGAGVVYLSNANAQAWSGPIVVTNNTGAAPRIVLLASEQIGDTAVMSFGGTGTERRFQLNGFNETLGGLNDLPGVSGTRIVEAAGDGISNAPARLCLNVAAGISNNLNGYVRNAAGGATNSAITLVKTGAGTQTFSAAAGLVNYSGPTTISNGVLELSGTGSVLANSPATLAGGTLKFSGGGTRATPVAGNGTLQVGANTFITTATNTYTGNTFVSAGTLQLGDGTLLGVVGTDITNNGAVKFMVPNAVSQTYAGVISGTGSLTKDGGFTNSILVLTGTNSFTGNVTVNAGAVFIKNSGGLGSGTKTVQLSNGTVGHPEIHLDGSAGNINLPAGIGFTTSWAGTPMVANEAGDNTIAGNFNLTSGGGDSYVAVNGGTLTLSGGISPSQANRNLLLGGAGNGTVSGVISNGTQVLNSLRKVDAGVWTLSGSNTFTGPTKVEAGALLVNGSLFTNTVTVFSNALLGGTGVILGAVTNQVDGRLRPGLTGLDTSTLTISDNLGLAGTAAFVLNRTNAQTASKVAGLTAVRYGGTLVVSNVGPALQVGDTFTLFQAASYSGGFTNLVLPDLAGLAWNTNSLGVNGSLSVQQGATAVSLLSSENPSGFQDGVFFTATNLPAGAAGYVLFNTTSGLFSSNLVSGGVAVSDTITNLPRGANLLTAIYGGDSNYLPSTNTLSQVVTNHPPQATVMNVSRLAGVSLKVRLSEIATNWSDVDGDTVALTGINWLTTNAVTLQSVGLTTNLDGSYVITNTARLGYTNGLNVNDQFSYTLTDSFGDTNIGYVNLLVVSSVTGSNTIASITGTNPKAITAHGIPGYSYVVERTTNLDSGSIWVDISTNQAGANGVINATDDFNDLGGTAPGSAYYRLKWQP